MKPLLCVIAAAAMAAASTAMAADEGPSFEKGPVWDYLHVRTVDGHFDDYMNWVSTAWKSQEEALKRAGVIIDYKVLLIADPRQGEPDVILATEYRNMAAFDHSEAEEYALQAKISGSIAKSNSEQAARSAIRTVQSDVVLREAILK